MTDTPAQNYLVDCQQPHAEVIEVSTRAVWQTIEPLTREALAQLTLPDGIAPIGVGTGVMDAHYFRQSPGADAPGPVRVRIIDDVGFIHCATPSVTGPEQPIPDGPARLMVDKHHTIIFEAGSEIAIIRMENGAEMVQVISATPEGGGLLQKDTVPAKDFSLPPRWQLRIEKVAKRTEIDLPNPTEVWFFADGSSFQGPVNLAH